MRYRWFDKEKTQGGRPLSEAEGLPEVPSIKKRRVARAELFGLLLSAVVFIYGLFVEDIPILFLATAFFLHKLRSYTGYLGEKAGAFLDNLFQGMSLALFVGALFMAFF